MNTQSNGTLNNRRSSRRQPTQRTVAAAIVAGACVLAGSIAPAAAQPIQAVAAETQTGTAAAGVSLFVGPPTGGEQLITGYSGGTVYTNTRPNVIDINDENITLRRNGVYHVHVEAILFFDADDPTAPDGAAGFYSLMLDGEEWVSCFTPANGSLPVLPSGFGPGAAARVAKCSVDFTLHVKGNEPDFEATPYTFGRNTTVQVRLIPNEPMVGDNTLAVTRVEVTRIGR